MKNLVIIPARGGSSRLKNKNILPLGEIPLIAHSIKTSLKIKNAKVLVSSDDDKILDISKEYGAEIILKRPKDISSNNSPSILVITHALDWLRSNTKYDEPKAIIFKPPTNPFITSTSINNMIDLLEKEKDLSSVVTITKSISHPFKYVAMDENGNINNEIVKINNLSINDFEMSQDWPMCFEGSPACRISKMSYFKEISIDTKKPPKTYNILSAKGYLVSNKEALDIDSKEDFERAKLELKN